MRMRIRIGVGVGALVLALAAPAIAASGASANDETWAWAVVRKPKAADYRITSAKDAASSSGGPVRVMRQRKGNWTVSFKGIDGWGGGNVLVTPFTSGGGSCVVLEWFGKPLTVEIECRGSSGDRADIGFIVNFVRVETGIGQSVYLWADQRTNPDYVPDTLYSYNPDGGTNAVQRTGTGNYAAFAQGSSSGGDNVQVSGYGNHAICRVLAWFEVGPLSMPILCSSGEGDPADSRFTLVQHRGVGLRAGGGGKWAYLFADRPSARSYKPDPDQRRAKPAGSARITRLGRGRYVVRLKSMPLGGAVQVTPFGFTPRRCNVKSIRRSGKPQRIGVHCYDSTGTKRRDASFTLSYVR